MCRIHDLTNVCYDIWEERKIDEYPSWRVRPFDIRYSLLLVVRIPKKIYSPPSLEIFTCDNLWISFLTIQGLVAFLTTSCHFWQSCQRFDKSNHQTTDENLSQIQPHPIYFSMTFSLIQRGLHSSDKWYHRKIYEKASKIQQTIPLIWWHNPKILQKHCLTFDKEKSYFRRGEVGVSTSRRRTLEDLVVKDFGLVRWKINGYWLVIEYLTLCH